MGFFFYLIIFSKFFLKARFLRPFNIRMYSYEEMKDKQQPIDSYGSLASLRGAHVAKLGSADSSLRSELLQDVAPENGCDSLKTWLLAILLAVLLVAGLGLYLGVLETMFKEPEQHYHHRRMMLELRE